MASLIGMNRFFNNQAVQGLTQAANMQGQREQTKDQLETAHDATVKGATATMAGTGAMIGAVAPSAFSAMSGAAAGAEGMSWSGPGMIVGAAVGALAGWLMSEFG